MTQEIEAAQIRRFEADEIARNYVEVLRKMIRQKSIFAQQVGLKEMAVMLKEIFEAAGAQVVLDETYQAPFVMATFTSPRPDAKTLIFYNHYDTVPADGDQVWTDQPFELSIREGYMYGRGVDDDKGHITARLTAVVKYLREVGALPVNIIFIMEGAEESASVDLDKYLIKYRDQLAGAELLIWEQGIRNHLGQLEISGGNKGIVTFDLSVESAEVDIHSSFGGTLDSASWYLTAAIQSLRDREGRILVPGILEQVQPPTDRELALVQTYATRTLAATMATYGIQLPALVESQEDFLAQLFFAPSIGIQGLTTGYTGQGVKTILPATATAKMEVRLVPGLTPEGVLDKIKQHLVKLGFDQVKVTMTLGEMPYRSDLSAPAIDKVIQVAQKLYPDGISVLPTSPGTGPMHTVFHHLGVPMCGFGLGNINSRDHAGDENVSLADYYSHIQMIKELIATYEVSYH